MKLLPRFLTLIQQWRPCFADYRTHRRAVGFALSLLVCLGRRTISRAICAQQRQFQSWDSKRLDAARSVVASLPHQLGMGVALYSSRTADLPHRWHRRGSRYSDCLQFGATGREAEKEKNADVRIRRQQR